MQKTTVYRFEYFDKVTRTWVVACDLATERAIQEMGAVVLYETAREVDSMSVGHAGIVRRDPAEDRK